VAANVRKCKAKGLSPSTVIVLLGVYWLAATKPIAPRSVHIFVHLYCGSWGASNVENQNSM
jgi:hypothetical protein